MSSAVNVKRASSAESPPVQFCNAMRQRGVMPPDNIIADSKIHRFATPGEKDRDCWYVLHGDYGAFGNWSSDIKEAWCLRSGGMYDLERRILHKKIDSARRQYDAQERRKHENRAGELAAIWEKLPRQGSSPYLDRKQVGNFGCRFGMENQSVLMVPGRDIDGKLWTFQAIDANGGKKFQLGARVKGCFHIIGADSFDGQPKIAVAEGYATGTSIHMATGIITAVAFDAGNLEPVIAAIEAKHPAIKIIIAGDEDIWKPEKGNKGRTKAEEAAKRFGCNVVFPIFRDTSTKPTDFNDLHRLEGLEAVKAQLLNSPDVPTEAANITKPDLDAEIKRLAALPPLEYDKEREAIAKKLAVRVGTLDDEVKRKRKVDAPTGQGRPLELLELEPWDNPVDGVALLDELAAAILSYVVMDTKAANAVALWIVHTHLFDVFNITPRLGITSPEKQCGKTTLLDVLQCLVPRPLLAASVSASVVFRTIEMAHPTLLIDEADTFLPQNEELRGALNSGHRSNGTFIRNISMGDNYEPRMFSTFAPVAIALIGRLPETLEDRSIPISLCRRKPDEPVMQFSMECTDELSRLARMATRWAYDARHKLVGAKPAIPGGIYNRMADNWRPLLAIADVVAGEWPERAREAAIALSAGGDTEQSSLRAQLLADIRDVFNNWNADKLPSAELVEALAEIEGRAWGDWKGKPITTNALARQLQYFKIRPNDIKFDGKNLKGYEREQFKDAWSRYLSGDTPTTIATPLPMADYQGIRADVHPLPGDNGSGLKTPNKASISAAGSGVAVANHLWEAEV